MSWNGIERRAVVDFRLPVRQVVLIAAVTGLVGGLFGSAGGFLATKSTVSNQARHAAITNCSHIQEAVGVQVKLEHSLARTGQLSSRLNADLGLQLGKFPRQALSPIPRIASDYLQLSRAGSGAASARNTAAHNLTRIVAADCANILG